MRALRVSTIVLLVLMAGLLPSCDVEELLGDCQIDTVNFTSTYGPSEQRTHAFDVDCAGTITVHWACPQCPQPNAGRLRLIDPVGGTAFTINGAGFSGQTRPFTTLLEGRWTILIQGTGGSFVNNYSVDVTFPSRR